MVDLRSGHTFERAPGMLEGISHRQRWARQDMCSLKKDGENCEPRPDRRDLNQDQPPREDPDAEPTQPVGDPEPAVGPVKTTPGEATRPLRPPSPAEASLERAVCKMCGKSFDSTQGLVDHEITTHPNVSVPPKRSNSEENGSAA